MREKWAVGQCSQMTWDLGGEGREESGRPQLSGLWSWAGGGSWRPQLVQLLGRAQGLLLDHGEPKGLWDFHEE